MKLYDYHSHNGYSGCASKFPYSVKDGWEVIQKRGITKWGLSNHFPTPEIYGDYIPELRKEIDAMENENILLGVELELKYQDGRCALSQQEMNYLDYIIGSVHNMPHGFLLLSDITEEEIDEFFSDLRNLLVNGLQKIPVKIWGHPFMNEFEGFGDLYWKEYIRPIYLECLDILAKKQIAFDINPAYVVKCGKFAEVSKVIDEMFALALENPDIYFVTSSDAHSLENLGDLSIALSYVEKYGIPESRILEIYKK